MLKSATYKILAQHFGKSANVNVVFEKNATPQTDGKKIILPTELNGNAADVTLATLLHECAHVEKTNFNATQNVNSVAQQQTLNVLEDIRVDAATLVKYPQAQQLQRASIDYVIKNHAAQLQTETLPQQILKSLILAANGYNVADVYGADVTRLAGELQTFIDTARTAASTDALIDPARELARLIMGTAADQQKQQRAQQGENGKQQDGSDTLENYKQDAAAADAAQTAADAARKTADEKTAAYNAKYDEYKSAQRRQRLNETKSRKAADQRTAEKYADRSRDAAAEKIKTSQQLQQTRQDVYAAQDAARKAATAADAAQEKIEQTETNAYGNSKDSVSLLGFNALDADALKSDAAALINGSATLDELIRDALILKRDENTADENGSKINARRLATLAAGVNDTDDLFLTTDAQTFKTRVAFVIDGSGSMGTYYKNDCGTRANLAADAAAVLLDALQSAIDSGAPADFNVYVFGGKIAKIIDGCAEYTHAAFLKRFQYVRDHNKIDTSSTHLTTAVNTAAQELKNSGENSERVIVIITDANVDAAQLADLRNGTQTDGERVIFIGARVHANTADARALFGEYNLTDAKTAADVLSRALLNAAA